MKVVTFKPTVDIECKILNPEIQRVTKASLGYLTGHGGKFTVPSTTATSTRLQQRASSRPLPSEQSLFTTYTVLPRLQKCAIQCSDVPIRFRVESEHLRIQPCNLRTTFSQSPVTLRLPYCAYAFGSFNRTEQCQCHCPF